MKINKIIPLISIFGISIFLSGCSLNKNSQNITNTVTKSTSGIFKTVDSGESWDSKSFVYSDANKIVTISDSLVYDIEFSPYNNYMFITTKNNGIYYSKDKGEQWISLFAIGNNVKTFSYVSNNPNFYYVGYQKDLYKTEDAGGKWEIIYTDPDSNIVKVKTDANNSKYILLFMADGRVIRSTDGSSFKVISNFANFYKKSDDDSEYVYKTDSANLLGIRDVYFAGENGNNLTNFYVVLNNGRLYYTQNGGVDFIEKNLEKSNITGTVRFLKFFPNSYKSFIIAIDNEGIYKTSNTGNDFTKIKILTNKNKNVTAFAISPKNQNIFYYALGNLIYKSTNAGDTWISINSPVTRNVSALTIDPSSVNSLYLGSDIEQRLVTNSSEKGIFCDLFGVIFPQFCNTTAK